MSVYLSAIHRFTPNALLNGFFATGAVIACLMMPHQAQADNHFYGQNVAPQMRDQRAPQVDRRDNGNYNGWNRGNWSRGNDRHYEVRNVYVPQRQVVYYYPTQYYPPAYYQPPVYLVGDRLVNFEPVPQRILYRLQPAPRGYYYGYRNDNVYMLRQSDNVITQIISALLN